MSMGAAAVRAAAKKAAKVAARKSREKNKNKHGIWWVLAASCIAIFMLCQMGVGVIAGSFMGSTTSQMAADAACDPNEGGDGGDGGGDADVVYASDGPVRLPVTGKYSVTSNYGMRDHPTLGVARLHAGVDLATVPTGGDIVAPKDGTVQNVTANAPGAGNFIAINHGGGLVTRYLHLSQMHVKTGDKVKIGQKIAKEGNTTGGTGTSTGSHLHFEVRKNDKYIDPRDWLKSNKINLPEKGSSGTAAGKPATGGNSGSGDAGGSASPSSGASAKQASSSGGGDFSLPKPNMNDRRHSKETDSMPIPANIQKLYEEAAKKYGLPWELVAGIGMVETHHGRIKAVSSAGAIGHTQFTPPTWTDFGVDGDGDGDADINNTADNIHSAANKLAQQGAKSGAAGVKDALFKYNNASWYVNDVLYHAHKYGKGDISVSAATADLSGGGGDDCEEGAGQNTQPLDAKACVTRTKKELSRTEQAGQLIMAAMQPGQTSSLDSYISNQGLGNALYLGEWSGSSTVKKASDHLQSKSPTAGEDKIGMLVAADQEGGQVQILSGSGFSTLPSGVKQGQMSNLQASAEKWGKEMKGAGVNVNLAPVADTVPTSKGKANEPIGKWSRQYGSTPDAASKGSVAFTKGMQAAGVEPTVKHFPGLGRITGNTDLTSQNISDSTATTSDTYLDPFSDSIDAGANIVMVGSAKYPKIDPSNSAAFSEKIVSDLLRDDLGFKGVAITDDVGVAKAVSDTAVGDRATKFVGAGGDIVLTAQPSQVPTMVSSMKAKADADTAFRKKMDASVTRVLTLKHDMGLLKCAADEGSGGGDDSVTTNISSTATSSCPRSGSPGEKGLNPSALNGLRCGHKAAPWLKTTLGIGERAGASDHGSGDAVDYMIPNYKSSKANKQGWDLANWMRKNADNLDVKYIIFDKKIWNPNRDSEGWRDMEGRGNDTEDHRDHVHVSFN